MERPVDNRRTANFDDEHDLRETVSSTDTPVPGPHIRAAGIDFPLTESEDATSDDLRATQRAPSPNRNVAPPPTAHYDTQAQADRAAMPSTTLTSGERTLELREEQLVAHKELREAGEVRVRTQIEEVPGRLEVEAYREEVEIEHEPVGQVVRERVAPWEENGTLVVPVYEEQLVVVKRLLLREHLRIRRVATTEKQLYEDTLRRERLVVEDVNHTGLVHEQYPMMDDHQPEHEDNRSARQATDRDDPDAEPAHEEGGFLHNLVRKALQ